MDFSRYGTGEINSYFFSRFFDVKTNSVRVPLWDNTMDIKFDDIFGHIDNWSLFEKLWYDKLSHLTWYDLIWFFGTIDMDGICCVGDCNWYLCIALCCINLIFSPCPFSPCPHCTTVYYISKLYRWIHWTASTLVRLTWTLHQLTVQHLDPLYLYYRH